MTEKELKFMERTLIPQFDIELKALLESIYLKIQLRFPSVLACFDAANSGSAMNRMGCQTILVLQEKVLRDSECFYDLLQSLTIPVSEMFRDPSYFLALREKVIPHLKTLLFAQNLGRRMQHGEEVIRLRSYFKKKICLTARLCMQPISTKKP